VVRVLPPGVGARIELGSWPLPPLFELLRDLAVRLSADELYRTLNMGIGMVAVCAPGEVDSLRAAVGEPTWVIGELTDSNAGVELVAGPAG
jgi:phosphoribosylaminoimidazole (AIR) synthetase